MSCDVKVRDDVAVEEYGHDQWKILAGDQVAGYLNYDRSSWGGIAVPRKTSGVIEYTGMCCREHLINEILEDGDW